MSLIDQKISQGVSQYHQPKPEGDIDLIDKVRQAMINSGLAKNVEDAFNTHRFITDAEGKLSNVQQFQLNRFFNQQLMSCSASSTEERYCLIPNGTPQDWLKLFETKIIPYLVSNDLPRVI